MWHSHHDVKRRTSIDLDIDYIIMMSCNEAIWGNLREKKIHFSSPEIIQSWKLISAVLIAAKK